MASASSAAFMRPSAWSMRNERTARSALRETSSRIVKDYITGD